MKKRRMAWRLSLLVQFPGQSRPHDQPTPPIVPTMLAADVPAGRQRAVTGAVGQRPLPRPAPELPGRAHQAVSRRQAAEQRGVELLRLRAP
jgi:hypothetical protein